MASSTAELTAGPAGRTSGAPTPPLGLLAAGLVLGAVFAAPAVYLIWQTFTADADPAGLLTNRRTLDPLGRTLQLAGLVSLTAMLVGTALAWLTTRTDLPGARLWRVLLPLPLVVPTFVGAAAMIRTVNPGGLLDDLLSAVGVGATPELRGLTGAWLVLTLFTYPYVYLPAAARFRQLPGALEDTARVLGDGPWRTFRRVCLPQAAPAIGAGTVLVFLYAVSDFGAVILLRYDTLTRAINTSYLADRAAALALSFVLLTLAIVVVVVERWLSARGGHEPVARSSPPSVYPLGRWRLPALGLVVGWVVVALGGPIASLVDWSVGGLVSSRRGGRGLTIDGVDVAEATWGSLQVGVLAAIVAIVAVLPIAYLNARHRSMIGATASALVISTFAVPGLLIALSVRFWTLPTWADALVGDTMALLVFAYVVRFGSLAMGVTLVAVRSVPPRLGDAAATLGAGRWRRLRTIDLPIVVPGLSAGAGLVLLSVMKELPISLLVSPLGYSNLATRIFLSFQDAFVAEAGILALVLVALSFVLSWFLVLRRADHL
ncbi:MAG: iron ABC transporter permease [Actinomycetota bacterium]